MQEHSRGSWEVLEKPDRLAKTKIIEKLRKFKEIMNLHEIAETQNLSFIFSRNATFHLLNKL